jgi:hypothetical protein
MRTNGPNTQFRLGCKLDFEAILHKIACVEFANAISPSLDTFGEPMFKINLGSGGLRKPHRRRIRDLRGSKGPLGCDGLATGRDRAPEELPGWVQMMDYLGGFSLMFLNQQSDPWS